MKDMMKVLVNGRVTEREISYREQGIPVPVIHDDEKILRAINNIPVIVKVKQ